MDDGPPDVVVVDVGNTATKVVSFDAAGEVVHVAWGSGTAVVRPLRFSDATAAVAVSVSIRRLHELEGAWAGGAWPRRLLHLGRDFPLNVLDRTETPDATGRDRLCAAVAAHARVGGAAAVVGLGTAITVDAVDRDGAFLGGAIAPGLEAGASGLVAAAPRLRMPDLSPGEVRYPGANTAEAMRAGHLFGAAGAVAVLSSMARRLAAGPDGDRRKIPVVWHGGDFEKVAAALRSIPREGDCDGTGDSVHAPWLVAEGARLLWIRAGRPT